MHCTFPLLPATVRGTRVHFRAALTEMKTPWGTPGPRPVSPHRRVEEAKAWQLGPSRGTILSQIAQIKPIGPRLGAPHLLPVHTLWRVMFAALVVWVRIARIRGKGEAQRMQSS